MKRLLACLFLVVGLGLLGIDSTPSYSSSGVLEVCTIGREPNYWVKKHFTQEKYNKEKVGDNFCKPYFKSNDKELYLALVNKIRITHFKSKTYGWTHEIRKNSYNSVLEKFKTKIIAKKKPTQTQQVAEKKKTPTGCIEGNCINGQGTQLWPNGSKYVGEWKEGKVHGQGTWTHPSGDKYVGEWKNGLKHGQGTLTLASGSKYVGEFKDGKYHGQGTHMWADGNKYVGEWKEGKVHGQGTYTWVNGDEYVGEWKDRKSDGQGTLTKADGTIKKGIWKKGNLVKRNKIQTQIAKKEPTQTQQVAKQATTTLKLTKKITQLKKQPKKKEKKVAKKEKKTIVTEVAKREPSKCDGKKFNKKKCKEFEKMERKVTVETVMALGSFEAFNDYPEGMLEEFGNCKKQLCRAKKAGKKVYEYFVQRTQIWHVRHPGDMIHGMAWFEIMYLEKLRKNEKEITRFLNDDYGSSTLTRKKKKDIKTLHSLIKMNGGKIKMREALGLSADDSLATVLDSHWLLGDFLNNSTLKVSKVSLNSGLKKRKDLLEKYQAAIKKYKAKLKEGKEG